MKNASQDDLKAFGNAVKRARALKGWTLDELGAAIEPPVGKSLISKIEKARKPNLHARTVGGFIKALELDESFLDPFIDTDETEEVSEAKNERDADRLFERAKQDGSAGATSDDLLIDLANRFADGRFTDLETSYTGLRKALEAAENIRKRGEMPPDNTGSQFNAVLKEVAALNDLGDLDQADALLDAEEKRMFEAPNAEKELQSEQLQRLLERRLDQDRLRNDPAAAADRLILSLIRQSPPGGVFNSIHTLWTEWVENGRAQGDLFELRVALVLANRLYQRAKGRQKALALTALGYARFELGRNSVGTEMLEKAEQATQAAMKLLSQTREPERFVTSTKLLADIVIELDVKRRLAADEAENERLDDDLADLKSGTKLSKASLLDFDFDYANDWLKAVGFRDDANHLKDASIAEAFLDDVGELRDKLEDFIDFSKSQLKGKNAELTVVRAAEKILQELDRIADTDHIRARRLIELGGYFQSFSLEQSQREVLEGGLSNVADDAATQLNQVFARYFGPSLQKLQILNDLELGNSDPRELLTAIRGVLEIARNADGEELAILEPEAIASMEQMVVELEALSASIDEASTPEHRESLKKRFARGAGAATVTLGKYLEKSREYAKKPAEWVDGALKQFKRVKGLEQLWEFIESFFQSGGPPT